MGHTEPDLFIYFPLLVNLFENLPLSEPKSTVQLSSKMLFTD